MVPTPITLERIVLRPARVEDAAAMFAGWAQDPDVTRYLVWPPHHDVTETEAFLAYAEQAWEQGTESTWMLCSRQDHLPFGTISLAHGTFKAGLGYAMSRSRWGHGLMYEAARAVVDLAFSDPVLVRVGSYCDVDNVASRRLLERLGFSVEGTLRNWLIHPALSPTPRDCLCYAKVRGLSERSKL